MQATSMPAVAGSAGYSVAELQRFLIAADERIRVLQEAIAETRNVAGRGPDAEAEAAAAATRAELAATWLAAQRDADAIIATADADARAIIAEAEQTVQDAR